MALVGKRDVQAGYRVCDIAFVRLHLNRVAILLLIVVGILSNTLGFGSPSFLSKAVVFFMAGEHEDAISRMDDLIAIRSSDPTFYVVQARE